MLIELGEANLQLLILLIYPVGIIAGRIISYHYPKNPYYYLFMFFISHYLVFFIKLIYTIKEKLSGNKYGEIKEEDEAHTNSELFEFQIEKDKIDRKQKIIRIIFIGILYFISYCFFYYFNFIATTSFYGNISMITEMLYFTLFDRIILGNKIYSHHLLSIIIISLSIVGLFIILMINFIKNNEWDIWRDILYPTFLNIIFYFIFCYHLVKAKVYVEKYFISPYELMIYFGSIGLILLLIFEPITFYISCDIPVMCYEGHFAGIISGFKQSANLTGIFIFIFGIFCLFLTAFGLWLTVKYLSPSHFLTTDSIITFGLNIMLDCYIGNFLLLKNPLFYLLSLLTFFGCLIYNEIIILKIFSLNYNTRIEILKRQNKETIYGLIKDQRLSELSDRSSNNSVDPFIF